MAIPFNYDHKSDAAAYIAEQLRLRGHDARDEYLGSNTSVIVELSPTRNVLLAGWGQLDGWAAEYDEYSADTGMREREYDTAEIVPDSQTNDIDRLVLVLGQYLGGVYPAGHGPRSTPVRPLPERRAYNSIYNDMWDVAGQIGTMAREIDNLTDDKPYIVLTDHDAVRDAANAASDALDVAHRLMVEAHRLAKDLYERTPG